MIRMHWDLHAFSLDLATGVDILVPQAPLPDGGGGRPAYPVLYLLHGLSDDETIWHRRTALERYAEAYPFVIVMPNGYRGFYTDTACGERYWTYLSEELPARVQSLLPVSAARADTYAAGLSMGGYGAFKLALRRPERYAAAASLSGALDAARLAAEAPEALRADLRRVFGPPDRVAGGDNDLFALAARVAAGGGPRPRLWQTCGTEDYLLADSRRFRDHALALDLALTWGEAPGAHTWAFWDTHIPEVLAWLAAGRTPAAPPRAAG